MNGNRPTFTAYNQDDEPWRLHRLAQAHAFAKGFMAHNPGCPNVDDLVRTMHDHKGMVKIVWTVTPTKELKAAYVAAWEAAGETADYVSHQVDSCVMPRLAPWAFDWREEDEPIYE